MIGGEWVLPTILEHGNAEQQDRFVEPSLRADIIWCQLFSEPGAGSDLAGLSTKARKVDGGWVLSGQKVWNSGAHEADWGSMPGAFRRRRSETSWAVVLPGRHDLERYRRTSAETSHR